MKAIKLLLLVIAAVSVINCSAGEQSEEKYPMFWTWMDYNPKMNFDSLCVVMNECGIDGLMLNAPTPDDYRVAIPIAHKYGIEVYAWLWTMNLEHGRDSIVKMHPEWLSVNRNGKSLADTTAYVDYYKFLCPALPEVREYLNNKIRAYCEVEGLNGIAIDYHRFVDVVLPTSLWPRYGIVQDREYAEWDYGYHPEMLRKFKVLHGYDPRIQKDPSLDVVWRQFRCDQISEVANGMAEIVHSYGKVMAASPFPTPAMSSRMVRQDWKDWNLDIVFPMVYSGFYTFDSTFISDCTIENAKTKNPMTTLYCGMTISTDSTEMVSSMEAALNNGAQGVAIFTVSGLRTPEIRKVFKNYTDSMRVLKANGGLRKTPIADTMLNKNPFNNEAINRMIGEKMRGYIAVADVVKQKDMKKIRSDEIKKIASRGLNSSNFVKSFDRKPRNASMNFDKISKALIDKFFLTKIDLCAPELINEYDATKYYTVKDSVSGVVFNVDFYFYGGIFSGWNVTPEQKSYVKYSDR